MSLERSPLGDFVRKEHASRGSFSARREQLKANSVTSRKAMWVLLCILDTTSSCWTP